MSFGRPYLLEVDGCIHDGWLAIRNSKNVFDITYLLYVLSSETIRKQYKSLAGAGVVTNLNKDLVQQVVVFIPYLKEQQKIAAFFTALDEKISLETQKEKTLRTIKDWCCKKLFREEIHLVDTKKWAEKRFEDIVAFINGRAYSQDELLNEGKYLVLRVGNFFTNSKYYYSNLELDPDKYANNGDLLYSWSASFGPRIWEGDKVIFHYHIWKVVPKEIDKKFLFYALQYDVGEIKSQLNGGTMSHLTKKSMEERFLKVPSSAEQKAIGDFLTLLDTRINLSLRKLEVLRTMRRSFMQQMFV